MRHPLNNRCCRNNLRRSPSQPIAACSPHPYNPAGLFSDSRFLTPDSWPMLARKPIFPNVIEMNFQAGQVLGCCVYLVFDGSEWLLIDIGLEETVDEIVELVRQMDFPLSKCKMLIG